MPAPPAIISTLFSAVDPDSIGLAAAAADALAGAAAIAVFHDGADGPAEGTRSMMVAGGMTKDDAAGAPRTVVSETVLALCAMSGVAMTNAAIALVTLRRPDMCIPPEFETLHCIMDRSAR
jgi:hypothetical protein